MKFRRLVNNGIPELDLNQLQFEMKHQIEKKIKIKKYNFESITCPICNCDDKELIGEKDRYGLYFSTNLCKKCGLVYTNPRMTQSSYNEFYNLEYRKLYGGKERANDDFFHWQRKFGKRIYHFLDSNNLIKEAKLSILEVGCGAGGIIDYFREKGHHVKGIDLGEEYINYGKEKHNLDLEIGTLNELSLQKKPDLIIYSHVLEHILDIKSEIDLIKNIMKKDTILYVEVPGIKQIHNNYDSNILKYFQNAHTFHFTLESLTNLMHQTGFELIFGNQFIMSAFKLGQEQKVYKSDYYAVNNYFRKIKIKHSYLRSLNKFKKIVKKSFFRFLDLTHSRNVVKKINNLWVTKYKKN